jgi:hypothetical protein
VCMEEQGGERVASTSPHTTGAARRNQGVLLVKTPCTGAMGLLHQQETVIGT